MTSRVYIFDGGDCRAPVTWSQAEKGTEKESTHVTRVDE